MGEAFLDYKKGGSSFDISGIIEDYYVYAGEKVSAGDFVEFINGIAGKIDGGTSTDTYLNGANTCETNPKAVELPNGNVFIVHRQRPSNAYLLYGMVCTIEGAKITAGTDTRLTNYNDSTAGVNALVLPSGDVLVSYTRTSVYGMVCTISGTTISVGSVTELHSNSTNIHELILLSDGKFLVLYPNKSSSQALYGAVCSVSGTTVTGGTATALSTKTNSGSAISPTLLSDGKVLVAHWYDSNKQLAGIVLTVSGTTISKGTDTLLSSTTYSGYAVSAQTLPSGKVFVAHTVDTEYYLYGIVCSISGTTITTGTDTVLKEVSGSGIYISTVVLPDGKVFVAHSLEGSDYYLNGMICTISDTTVTAGTDVSLISAQQASFYMSTCLLQSGNIFIAHAYYISSGRHFYAQIFGIDKVNNIPTNQIAIPTYETQVRPATTLPCNGVAKSSGKGGDSTGHKDVVSIYKPEIYSYIDFTSNPAPTTWTDSSDYLSATATNKYGEWSVEVNSIHPDEPLCGASEVVDAYGIDGSITSNWLPEALSDSNSVATFTLKLPENVSIKPSTVALKSLYIGSSSALYGYNGTEWVRLTYFTKTTGSPTTEEVSITTDEYYTQFRLQVYRYSSTYNEPQIHELRIASGTLKILE